MNRLLHTLIFSVVLTLSSPLPAQQAPLEELFWRVRVEPSSSK
ncbi:hypothetical protein [Prosthecobacter sp.]|jgi:hypothetical protein